MVKIAAQFAKYLAIGATNTVIDFGILNILMFFTGFTSGINFAIFKGISVMFAIANSYYLNKYWTFRVLGEMNAREFSKFIAVAIVGFSLNVGVASYIVNMLSPFKGFTPVLWANFGAFTAAASITTWNFLVLKYFVFRRR